MNVRTSSHVWFVLLVLVLLEPGYAQPLIRHELQVVLQPHRHQIQVTDTIALPSEVGTTWDFVLHAGLQPSTSTPGVHLKRQPTTSRAAADGVPLEAYRMTLPPDIRTFVVSYGGTIRHPLAAQEEEYARGFRTTPGTIDAQGVYLSASTSWYPHAGDALLTFGLDVRLPEAWDAVSQGERTRQRRQEGWRQVRWETRTPQEQIYLVGGKYTEYSQPTGGVRTMVFLRSPDPQLAQKYLQAAAQYIPMYADLIGPYPYSKFAVVENVWESGYGMPSFTLLGPRVMRFPFILHSSYPHEILHNWWGNGVFVREETGNWSEGLTAYLADHLIQEQRGTAVAYRRTALQKYADYVASHRDFPLTAFRARHNAVTEAVGYGKAMMLFHMIRRQIGDAAFVRALRTFYRAHRFRRAGYDDLREAFATASGANLEPAFDQWITRPGAPEVRLTKATVRSEGDAYLLTAVLDQVQSGPSYILQLPLAVSLEGQEGAYQTTVRMAGKHQEVTWRFAKRPLRLDVDPQFDVFRRLQRREIPPALTQMFGAERALMLLPSAASPDIEHACRQLARQWQQALSGQLEVLGDDELRALPDDRAVWLCGWDNRWRAQAFPDRAGYDLSIAPDSVRIAGSTLRRSTHAVVLTARHPLNPQLTVGWIATDNPAAMPGLARKLPHYGKYSYLGFTGDEPVNVLKGQWPVVDSPMVAVLPRPDGRPSRVERASLAPRQALTSLPTPFSAERMLQTIRRLASPAMRGRGFGTPELDRAAEFLVERFRQAGLQPAGDQEGSYLQTWRARGGEPERAAVLKNVVGMIPGRKAAWAEQSVVVGAHYDHLGLGWPDAHQGDVGKVHPGADDNASGIAVLLELARLLGKTWQPERTVVFVAFTAEEAGRLGSQHYVRHMRRFPAAQTIAMVNLDGVGRLGQNQLMVFGTSSARQWPHIFRGVSYVTGVPVKLVAAEWGTGDQRSFLDAGIPAVQLFSGVHGDYHRPTDTVDKIDADGLVRVASVARETVVYLAGRETPLTTTLGSGRSATEASPHDAGTRRRVSLGTVPDFAYEGRGYRIGDVRPDSPAARAGLQAGDVIVRFGTTSITDLRALAQVLRRMQPGNRIELTYIRNGREYRTQARLVPR
jgi:aminopeptidase N